MAAEFANERGEKAYTPDTGQLHHYGRLAIDDQDRLHLLIRNRKVGASPTTGAFL